MGTEAGKAAVEVGQLLLANEKLNTSDRQDVQGELSNAGLYHEQQVQFLATLDENASKQEILSALEKLKQNMQNDESFDVALKASIDPEQLKQHIKEQIDAYEPTDEDVDADQFKSMANYVHEADDSAFEDGGMFEDISPDIRDSAEALEDFVEGILRYEDALSTLAEKEED
jgi:hypothetical protein